MHLYYNQLTGGLDGARDRFLGTEASDYWASSYRQGMEWLNEHAPEGSHVAALIAPWIIEISGHAAPVDIKPNWKPAGLSLMTTAACPTAMFILGSRGADETPT
jgi:hypothetical protein